MTWTTVYDNPAGSETVEYDWKVDHEYSIYAVARHRKWEIDNNRVIISGADLTPAYRGLCVRGIDSWMLFVQGVGAKKIHNVGRRGAGCPILRILERPVVFGTTDVNANENWELFWTGAVGTVKIPFPYENDYEYLLLADENRNVGPYGGNPKWLNPVSLFLTAEVNDQYDNGRRSQGEFHHAVISDGFVQFYNVPNNPTAVSGRTMRMEFTNARVFKAYRRPIRLIQEPDQQYCGWRRIFNALPNGRFANGLPFNWPDNTELAVVHTDPKGINEIATAFIETSDILFDSRFNSWTTGEHILAQDSGSSAPMGLTGPLWGRRGYKTIHSWGRDGVRALAVYEKLAPIPQVVIPPDPDPIPPDTPCEDRCYVEGTIWEQEAVIEARIVSPPDWEQREYEFEWGGDIDGTTLRVAETQAGGRIVRLILNHTLRAEDHLSTLDFNIRVTATDKGYEGLGIGDTAEATLTFELPCVIVGNVPEISIEDISIVEQDVTHDIQIRVLLSEPYIGRDPLCVDYTTRDGTATSDLSVTALARDDFGLPFITIIESQYSPVRVYIDGAFPKWYNSNHNSALNNPGSINEKTLIFSRNLANWLRGTRNTGKMLLMGDQAATGNYSVLNRLANNATGFRDYWENVAAFQNKTLDVMLNTDVQAQADIKAFLDGYECIIYFSSLYTGDVVLSSELVDAMIELNREGLGIALISDHGNNEGTHGFFKGANDFLVPGFGVRMKGSIDRNQMVLSVENFRPHTLWTGITGQISSNSSEAYVDAQDADPDYISTRGTICFNSGESEKVISVTILGDTEVETDETFTVELSNNTGGVLVKPVGTVTIVNDDTAAPCGLETPSGGSGVTETVHGLGTTAGRVEAFYDMYGIPDMMEIFYNNQLVATTGGMVQHTGSLSFYYPGPPSPSTCMIRMTGSGEGTAWNYRIDCPTPLVEVQALMYATTVETDAKKLVYTPPSPQEIFNEWNRFSNNNYFPGGVGASGEAAAWEFLTNPDRISQPLNTSTFTGFVSPVSYSNYTFEATLSGTGSDDDTVGLIIGYVHDGTNSRMIAISRTRGGNPLSGQPSASVNFGVSGYGVNVNGLPAFMVGTQGGWNGQRTKVMVQRTGNRIRARTTPFYNAGGPVPPYDDNAVIEFNLGDYPQFQPFLGESPYGYLSFSQAGSTYFDITFTGALINTKIYDAQALRTWDYDRGLNQWYDVGTTPQVDLGQPVIVLNPETGTRFLVTNTIQVL